jgi:hypothetical protein
LREDEASAIESFLEAVGTDPLDPEAACETIDPAGTPADASNKPLCDAARDRREAPFDSD